MVNIVLKQRQFPTENITLSNTIHPLLQRIYRLRGICSDEQLNYSTQLLENYNQLAGIDQAVEILYQNAKAQKKIFIVGDFDTDGATSTALIVTALNKMGVKNVSYLIPDRFEEGYGLSIPVVKRALARQAELIITVDNGISAFEAVQFAKENNIQVIITDHHLTPELLPNADAIINPNLPYCQFPSKNLAGVGVTFYFMLAFRAFLREKTWFEQQNIAEYNLANLLDLVALGTIADVVNLDQNNRILVQQGLYRIRSGCCCSGISALIKTTKCNQQKLSSLDLSFYLSPKINAAGRLENMSLGVELLISQHDEEATEIANILEELNKERKSIEQNMHTEALEFIHQLEQETLEVPNSFVIYHPNFHQGVVGVLSSRIKEKFYRPVISFALTDNGFLKGSGRSILGIHLRDVLEKIHHESPDMIVHFGGHAMAAGLTIHKDNLEKFSTAFEQAIAEILNNVALEHIVETDGVIENEYFNYQTAKMLKEAGPWGAAFPEPLFCGDFVIHQQKLLSGKHLKMVIEPIEGGPLLNAMAFNIDRSIWPDLSIKKIQAAYILELDEFRGNQGVTLFIRHLLPVHPV